MRMNSYRKRKEKKMNAEELDNRFNSVDVTESMYEKMDVTTSDFNIIAFRLNFRLPEGRYKSLCMTALEEAQMWANKSITHTELTD